MSYDAIILGTGQAGAPLAYKLADQGWKVAVIEQGELGGTCVNNGCTPTKTMVHRAQVAFYARHAARWGVVARAVSADLAKIVAQKDQVVQKGRDSHRRQIDQRPNLHLFRATARFAGPRQVLAGDRPLEGEKIFINTGARPAVPPIPGLATSGYLTSETILDLTELPSHLLVLGGGYIGLELGQMFARFGSRVTILQSGGEILPREDPEVDAELRRALSAEGLEFLLGVRTQRVERRGGETVLSVEVRSAAGGGAPTSREIAGSHLLVATGRRPNTDQLGLERAGIATDQRGFIQVNDRLETGVPGVWALGDVKGGPAFTHISYNDHQIVYANLVEGRDLSIAHRLVPYCVFTDPQLGGVGMTEREAREAGHRLKIGTVPMTRVARAVERDETAGLMKLVVDADTDRILGASILASEGGELVQILHTLMLADRPYTLLRGAIYIHPTLAEGFFFLMDAVKPA